jgi:hypothetical protein
MKQLLALALLLTSFAYTGENTPIDKPKIHRLQMGADLFWSHFRSGSVRDHKGTRFRGTVNGYYAGFKAGYDYLQPDAFYAGTEGVIACGEDDIQKKTSKSRLTPCNTCSHWKTRHEHRSHLWANLEQRLGYNAQSTILPRFIVTPYTAVGWHYESMASAHTYWYYAAAGLKTLQKFYQSFEIGFDFKAMFAFDIHDRGLVSIMTTQDKKTFWGFETAIPLRWLLGATQRWDVELKPYLLKLNLNSSQTIVGVRLVGGYHF